MGWPFSMNYVRTWVSEEKAKDGTPLIEIGYIEFFDVGNKAAEEG